MIPDILAAVFEAARKAGVQTLVDPARGRPISDYRGAAILKPNRVEASQAIGMRFDSDDELRDGARRMIETLHLEAAVITLEESQQAVSRAISDKQPCMNCHDLDNSPDFHFETYWPKIEHREE